MKDSIGQHSSAVALSAGPAQVRAGLEVAYPIEKEGPLGAVKGSTSRVCHGSSHCTV